MGKKSVGDILALITASGDILVGSDAGTLTKISKGASGKLMLVNGDGDIIWDNQMTGPIIAQINTDYTVAQMRNVIESTSDASGGNNGDIWLKYTA